MFIAHDLAVVRHMADRVAVMYLGKIAEIGAGEDLYGEPGHPYTRVLLSAIPVPDPEVRRERKRNILQGDPPSPADPPPGCRFHTRCHLADDTCRRVEPGLEERAGLRQLAACHHAGP
ncbi:hypothetical protein GCM10010404_62530 [Nonomuraea africana]|uniref:Oligopeptide/dipeptide ABC transporter ATP-binding protein n=1 Tax=Nonomuraea africana TaxID=46171 RepID=A0ABR9K672_9ACTN|nr:oligopeptide/dipeptide ABC transporter ATP-binding protein [Nonomuraea africana]